jgi:4-amino-4-deoxy-L-arabinose transferase-like glycosyltransferase
MRSAISMPFSAQRLPQLARMTAAAYLADLTILLVAGVVRLWRLGYHSVWFDEAVTLKWATSDPAHTWRVTFELVQDKHPPLYYVSLHYWMQFLRLFGLNHNDAALRVFGALLGAATAWLIYRMAAIYGGRMAGLLAGLLVALSPVLVWYSQELRMFGPATTWVVLASYCLLNAWRGESMPQRLPWWLGLIAALNAAAHSYLLGAFAFPTAGVALVALAWQSTRWRRFGEGVVALIVAGVLFLPLATNAWQVNSDESTPGIAFQNFTANLQRLLQIFTIWRVDWEHSLVVAALGLFALLLLLGILLPLRRSPDEPARLRIGDERIWLVVWIGAPLLIANLLLSRSGSIFSADRYLLFLAPFVLWACARGAVAVHQWVRPAGWLASGAAVVFLAAALPQVWSPRMARENWRAAANYVWEYQQASPGLPGAIVAHVDYTRLALEWYLRAYAAFDELPIYFPFGGRLEPEAVEEKIAPPLLGIADQDAGTLWLTQSHLDGVDDQRLVETWLGQHYPLITEQYPAGVKLTGYMLRHRFDRLPALSPAAIYPAAELVPGLVLEACELMTPSLSASDEQMHPPSGWVHVRLWWKAVAPLAQDYIATAQMVGPEGVWGDRLYRDNDALRRTPTSSWQPGEIFRDEVDINLNPVTPDGSYPVLIGVMDATGQPTDARAECGRVTIR